jgi:hypothetical protein
MNNFSSNIFPSTIEFFRKSNLVLNELNSFLPEKKVPEDLQEAKMQLWNTTKCNSTDFYNGTLPSSVLCAGYLSGYISICPVSTHKYARTQQVLRFNV